MWPEMPTRLIVTKEGVPHASQLQQHSRPATALAADPQLDRALEDVDPAVRIEAVERLGDRGDERSLALVRQALSDPMEAVRAAARQVLATRH